MFTITRSIKGLARWATRFRPRRFHSYCVGAAKTGTTSIASSFRAAYYRARHEPEAEQTNRIVIDYLERQIDKQTLQEILVKRDQRLQLDMESAHPLGYVAGVLAETFPDALFIVTLREPLSWLHSRLNFHHKADPPSWREYREYFWHQRHNGFAPEESPLQEYGLCSLDTYLSQYADHYRRVLAEVPEKRRLLIRTEEISSRLREIAVFVGAHSGKLSASHRKRSADKITPLSRMKSTFVKERIMHYCGDLIAQYFPERLPYYEERHNNAL